jgi:hypothetical protein
MNVLAAAGHGSSASPIVWFVLVGGVAVILFAFGWRPLKSRKISQSPVGNGAKAVSRTVRRGKRQPEDAS